MGQILLVRFRENCDELGSFQCKNFLLEDQDVYLISCSCGCSPDCCNSLYAFRL